ncbi:MAG: hypothetical protein U1F43_08790 [Myxococcota bacterium]
MRTLSLATLSLSLGLAVSACADAGSSDPKPATDPDLALATGKADATTDYWTTMRGTLELGATVHEEIDWPDYYLGRTLELRQGQTIEVKVTASRKSLVRVYGPAYSVVDGQPLFKKALVKSETKKQGGKQVAMLTVEAPADGTYMLLYGPMNVWYASYDITASCVAGCQPADACDGDDACDAGEYCGWNHVACITAPCNAAYDVCQARHAAGEGCGRDGECADGLLCGASGLCTAAASIAAEGESCGGFRLPTTVKSCGLGFDCIAPHGIIADIPGQCGKNATVAEILADPKAFDGHYVAVKGIIDARAAMCTKLGCSPANPCCNSCGANLALYDDKAQMETSSGIIAEEDGAALSCGGNECTWRDNCAVAPGNAWAAGWFRLDGGVTPTLAIEHRWAY